MSIDLRRGPARYYDLAPHFPNDITFYFSRLPSSSARVLELGCGTGRVTLPLAHRAAFLHGLDLSIAMLGIAREKLTQAGLGENRVIVEQADITRFDLGAQFDLIIAPFRVIQNLETDAQLDGLFACIRRHLAPGGRCILNAFRPNRPRDELIRTWVTGKEALAWEVEHEGERFTCSDLRKRLTEDPLVVYPDLIYRRYRGSELIEETVLHIPMRCRYPDEFRELIASHGFEIAHAWGGYAGETYGVGNELVVEFTHQASQR